MNKEQAAAYAITLACLLSAARDQPQAYGLAEELRGEIIALAKFVESA